MARADGAQDMMKLQCQQEFTKYDADGSGTISCQELVRAMQGMHAKCGMPEPNEEQVMKAMQKFDKNHDGVLDLEEFMDLFVHIMMKAQKPKLPPNINAMKKKCMEMFDQVAPSGKMTRQEFVSITQAMVVPMLNFPIMQVCSSQGPLGGFGPEVRPALQRAMMKFDSSGIVKLLGLFFECMDKDVSGTLERDEVKQFWDLAGGVMAQGGPAPMINLMFAIFDRDKDGKITLDEVCELLVQVFKILEVMMASVLDVLDSVITSKEVEQCLTKVVKMSPVMMMDANNDGVISRAEFIKFMSEQGILEGLTQQIQMLATPQNKAKYSAILTLRSNLAKAEASCTKQLLAKAQQWMKGGVDEATFLSEVIPIIKEQALNYNVADIQKSIENTTHMLGCPEDPMQKALMSNPQFKELQAEIQKVMKEKMAEHSPDMARALFRLLDLDCSGRITTHELKVLKALMDGILRLGTHSIIDTFGTEGGQFSEEEKAMLQKMYPDLFKEGSKPTLGEEVLALLLSFFDAIDRDSDGELSMEEVVGFLVKIMDFFLRYFKICTEMVCDAFCIQAKGMFKMLWEKLELKDVTQEQVPMLMQTVPILLMSIMMEAQQV